MLAGDGVGRLSVSRLHFESESDYEAARSIVSELFDEAAGYLTDRPHTHAGSSEFSFKE